MNYYFNEYRWFTTTDTGMFIDIEPANVSETEVVGELRSHFNGVSWDDIPYALPVFYNNRGWYTSTVTGSYTFQIPANVSETEVVGELRSHFNGVSWDDIPYALPVFYNNRGWYTSTVTGSYTFQIPANTDEPVTHGDLRSFFNGFEWLVLPYTLPVYYFDNYGWVSLTPILGRETSVVPPSISETEVVGELRSNFTGYNWVSLPYSLPAPPPTPPVEIMHITLLALNLRLTRAERDAIRAAEDADTDVSDVMYLMRQARYIDLARPETIAGINMLQTKGLLAAGRANAILTNAIQPNERPE